MNTTTTHLNEDAACFADALEGFAALCAADQTALIADLRAGRASKPAIQVARLALADSIDGAFDEDITTKGQTLCTLSQACKWPRPRA